MCKFIYGNDVWPAEIAIQILALDKKLRQAEKRVDQAMIAKRSYDLREAKKGDLRKRAALGLANGKSLLPG